MVSDRTFWGFGYPEKFPDCNEESDANPLPGMDGFNAVSIALLQWTIIPPFLVLLLAAFAHSIGPAPPVTREELEAAKAKFEARKPGRPLLERVNSKLGKVRSFIQRNVPGASSRADAPPGGAPPDAEDTVRTSVAERGRIGSTPEELQIDNDTLEAQRLFWPRRFGDEYNRQVSQHLLFDRDGVLRTGWREGGA